MTPERRHAYNEARIEMGLTWAQFRKEPCCACDGTMMNHDTDCWEYGRYETFVPGQHNMSSPNFDGNHGHPMLMDGDALEIGRASCRERV